MVSFNGLGRQVASQNPTTPVAALMALFTLATAVVFYDFWSVKGEARTAALNGFFEHISIIGGFLILMAAGPGRFVL